MNGFETFRIFGAMKLHFSMDTKYTIEKYGTSPKVLSYEKYETNPHRKIYDVVGANFLSEKHLTQYLASNMVDDSNIWIGQVLEEQHQQSYKRFKRFAGNPVYNTAEDIKKLLDEHESISFRGLFLATINSETDIYPIIIQEMINKKVYSESIITLSRIFPVFDIIDKRMGSGHILWPELKSRLLAYKTFVTVRNVQSLKQLHYEISEAIQNRI